jgi:hypothetical protein
MLKKWFIPVLVGYQILVKYNQGMHVGMGSPNCWALIRFFYIPCLHMLLLFGTHAMPISGWALCFVKFAKCNNRVAISHHMLVHGIN